MVIRKKRAIKKKVSKKKIAKKSKKKVEKKKEAEEKVYPCGICGSTDGMHPTTCYQHYASGQWEREKQAREKKEARKRRKKD